MKGLVDRNRHLKTEGTSQRSRYLAALEADYFRVDERSTEDIIEFVLQYAGMINFFDGENKPSGDWRAFFENDITIKLIRISAFDSSITEKAYRAQMRQTKSIDDTLENIDYIDKALVLIYELFMQIEKWKLGTRSAKHFNDEFCKLISEKFSELLCKFDDVLWLGRRLQVLKTPAGINFERFGSEWGLAEHQTIRDNAATEILRKYNLDRLVPTEKAGERVINQLYMIFREGETPAQRVRKSARFFNNLFEELLSFVDLVKGRCKDYLEDHLLQEGNIKPHIALFLAFCDVYKEAQADLNKFTKRHMNYYYRDVLKLSEKGFHPDTVHVMFELVQGIEEHLIPKGAKLIGGQDENGNDLIYTTDRELVVNKCAVADVKAIVQDTKKAEGELFKFMSFEPDFYHIDKSRRTELDAQDVDLDHLEVVELGFAIASTILNQDEGDRLLKFRFHVDLLTFKGFEEAIKVFAEEMSNSEVFGASELAKINHLLKDFLLVSYTCMDQWYKVPAEKIELNMIQDQFGQYLNQLELVVLLKPTDPMIDNCQLEDFPEAVAAEVPMFKFTVNPLKMFLFDRFNDLILDKVDINVDILGARNLRLQSDYGVLDPSSPFEPFGQIPVVGSTFYIGHETLFNYNLTDLRLNIQWFNMPTHDNGLVEYYRHYPDITTNQVFKAKVSLLKEKRWFPIDDKQVVPLFQNSDGSIAEGIDLGHAVQKSTDENTPVSNIRRINELDLARLGAQQANYGKVLDIGPLNHNTLDGYMKLELIGPQIAFGHSIYGELMTKTVAAGMLKKSVTEVPNEPMTPTIKSITVDYSATETIDFRIPSDNKYNQVYAIHPFGNVSQNKLIGQIPIRILPSYERGSYIHIGISNFEAPLILSMLFQVNESGMDEFTETPILEWHYLHDDRWLKIEDGQILYDTTAGLTNSGLIGFTFSKEVHTHSSLLTDEYFWLRCYCEHGAEFIDNIADIRTNAVSATFEDNGNSLEHLESYLIGNSISAFVGEHPQVQTIAQPYVSFSGRPAEGEREFFNRVSERLRHKDRAVNVWDFENLVLEQFSEVCRVRCMSHLDGDLNLDPGSVLVVVVPFFFGNENDKFQRPKLSVGHLHKIKTFLQDRTSTFIDVEVKNPIYEEIQISLDVRFRKGRDEGFYVNQLNEDLKLMLSSWFYIYDEQIQFGEIIHPTSVLKYVEDLEYIDYVTNFGIFQFVDGDVVNRKTAGSNEVEIVPSTVRSVLVSADNHIVGLVDEYGDTNSGVGEMVLGTNFTIDDPDEIDSNEGINTMVIGSDFRVHDDKKGTSDEGDFVLRIKRD